MQLIAASQRLTTAAKRPFGFDVVDGGWCRRPMSKTALRRCPRHAGTWREPAQHRIRLDERVGLDRCDARTVQRILAREEGMNQPA